MKYEFMPFGIEVLCQYDNALTVMLVRILTNTLCRARSTTYMYSEQPRLLGIVL